MCSKKFVVSLFSILGSLSFTLSMVTVAVAETVMTGTVAVISIDYPNGSHAEEYTLVDDEGAAYKLDFGGNFPEGNALQNGMPAEVRGELNGRTMAVSEYTPLLSSSMRVAAIDASFTGTRTSITIMVNLSDATVTSGSCSASIVTDAMYTGTESVRAVMEDSSYGQLTFSGSAANVVGPYTIAASASVCDPYEWASQADAAATADGVNLNNYQHRVYILPRYNLLACSWAGLGNVGCGTFCRSWIAECESPLVYAHEVGHNLGMYHAGTDTNDNDAIESEYGDNSCIMGSSLSWKHFNAPHKDQMGWFTTGQLTEVTSGGTYNLYDMNLDPSLTAGPQVLKIARDGSSYYYLSFRQNDALYDGLASAYAPKVSVHNYAGSGYAPTGFIDGLASGESYTMSDGSTVTVTAITSTYATVTIGVVDTDGDGFNDQQEASYGSNLNDPDSYPESLDNPINLLWNGFLRMTNIVELLNPTTSTKTVTLRLYDANGSEQYAQLFTLNPDSQFDVILNDLPGFAADSYGLVTLDASGEIDGRTSYYRTTTDGTSFEFAYSIPFENTTTGTSAVGFNTFNASTNPDDAGDYILNWLTVVNRSSDAKSFTVNTYNQTGTLVATRPALIGPNGRIDIDGGHALVGPSQVGYHEIIPDDTSSPYLAQLIRYATDATLATYKYAFPLLAQGASEATQYAPISRQFQEINWVEIINTTDAGVVVTTDFYNGSGSLVGSESVTLAAHAQQNYYVTPYLTAEETGFVKVSTSAANSVVVQSMFYFQDFESGSIATTYGSQGQGVYGAELSGSYNLFINANNWLRVINTSASSASITIRVGDESQVFTLGAYSSTNLALQDSATYGTAPDTYGFVELDPTSPAIIAENIRLRYEGTYTNFVFPTKMRPQL